MVFHPRPQPLKETCNGNHERAVESLRGAIGVLTGLPFLFFFHALIPHTKGGKEAEEVEGEEKVVDVVTGVATDVSGNDGEEEEEEEAFAKDLERERAGTTFSKAKELEEEGESSDSDSDSDRDDGDDDDGDGDGSGSDDDEEEAEEEEKQTEEQEHQELSRVGLIVFDVL